MMQLIQNKLLDGAVTADKIASDAVNSSKILDGSISDDSQPIQLQQ